MKSVLKTALSKRKSYSELVSPFSFLIIAMPFIMFHSTIPFLSDSVIGSDYLLYPIRYQMELLFSIKTGSFPLYVPGFASGHSAAALTLGQIYHPLPHIASMMPGYWSGKAVEWNSFYKLLSLGLTQFVLFLFLRRLKVDSLSAFLLSFITVYNLKILDLIRHGPPLEAYTGHLLLCAAIGWYFINPSGWTGPVLIIVATYLLVCSGHPEEMYYGLLGSALFTSVAPFFIPAMLTDIKVDLSIALRFWLKTISCLILGIMLSSAYLLPFYFEFISDNKLRVEQSYSMAVKNLDTFVGTINNFALPLRSLVYDAFGGSSLFLLTLLFPLLIFFRVKIPRAVWVTWGLFLLIFLFIQGNRTPVHRWVWEYFPLASSIRTPGRISMIMPFFMMLLLSWTIRQGDASLSSHKSAFRTSPPVILAILSIPLIIIYYFSFYYTSASEIFSYSIGHINHLPFIGVELIIVTTGIALLIVLARYNMGRSGSTLGVLLIIFALLQVGLVLKYRSAVWIEKKEASPAFLDIQRQKENKLEYPYYAGGGMQSSIVVGQLQRTFMEPFLGKIYTHIVPVDSRQDAYGRMERERLPQQLFIEGYSPARAKILTDGAEGMKEGIVELSYSSFNYLKFRVISQSPALFGLSYPYSGHWTAEVNEKYVPVYRANGAAHAVEIPAGENYIEFRYWSGAAFWGMVISCVTFALIGIVVCFNALNAMPRIIGVLLMLLISAGSFILWYNSLYSGENLNTVYRWSYPPVQQNINLAYGKKTWVNPEIRGCIVCAPDFSNTRVVDGDRSAGSGFLSRYNDIDFILDLSRSKKVKTVILFKHDLNPSEYMHLLSKQETFNYSAPPGRRASGSLYPFSIELSDDGSEWRSASYEISTTGHDGALNIVYDTSQTARYIMLKLAGGSMFSLDEVEVYGE
jgi:hypothetical protein